MSPHDCFVWVCCVALLSFFLLSTFLVLGIVVNFDGMVHCLSFVKAKSEVSPADVRELVEFGLDLFHSSQNKLHVQVMMLMMLLKCMTLYVNHGFVSSVSVVIVTVS